MAQLPDVSRDISLLRRFIRGVEDLPTNPSPEVEVAQNHAEILLKRLETPVRIAVAGVSGAGKSSLINLLLGAPLAPMGEGRVYPPVLFEHSDVDKTTVGWWDRPSKQTRGHVIKAAIKEEPDLISVGVDSPILQSLQLIDVSGLDRPGHDKDAVLALTQLADVLIWCSTVTQKLDDAQSKLVKMLPKRLTKNSLVVLTHADDLTPEACEAAAAEVEHGNGKDFLYVSYIATPQAWAAFHGEGSDPAAMWEQSGAPEVLADLMDLAVKTRKKEIAKIQRSIGRQVIPFVGVVPMPPAEDGSTEVYTPEPAPAAPQPPAAVTPAEPVAAPPAQEIAEELLPKIVGDTPLERLASIFPADKAEPRAPEPEPEPAPRAPEPAPPEPAPPQPEPEPEPEPEPAPTVSVTPQRVTRDLPTFSMVGGVDLYESWQEKLTGLYEAVQSDEIAEESDFIQSAQELVSDFLDDLSDDPKVTGDHDWLIADFEKANDLMILLQFESGDRTALDAALIVSQLTDSLSYV